MSTVRVETTLDPTVTFDFIARTITLTVIVTPPAEGSSRLGVAASPCEVPKGDWTMFWDLVLDDVAAHLTSIDLPELPLPSGNVTITDSHLAAPSRWTALLHNGVEVPLNEFSYTINVAPDDHPELITPHDPTISVVSDPPNG